jgi:pimeloyl-ACP methyl ester carboxylesterase
MGASAAVLRAAEDDELAACVLDSPFSSFTVVAREVVQNLRVKVPDFLVDFALRKLRGEIWSRARFDIDDLVPLQRAPLARSPVLFVVAKEDDFVLPHHTYRLYGAWGGDDKTLVTVGGAHNSLRPSKFLAYAADFLAERLSTKQQRPASTTANVASGEGTPAVSF